MNKENCKNESNCKQSFKAVENFLRRVAFNLGNTQSRTEVKIISCIPIDVTDLQQRIFQLQNELADIKDKTKESPKVCSICAKRRNGELSPKEVFCNECLLSTTSALSIFRPGTSDSKPLRRSASDVRSASRGRTDNIANTEKAANTKSFFAKKKKGHKKPFKTRLVYCAQTNTNTPFKNRITLADDLTPMKVKAGNKSENPNRSYLADVIRRQYQHQPLAADLSNVSDISSPVCRDNVPNHSPNSPYFESDACSCFHEQYQNIDRYMNNTNYGNKYLTSEAVGKFNSNAYYDSKFYDIVPVKEKKIKNRNDIDKHKGREPKKHIIKCWPEKARPKHGHKYVAPVLVNYCTVSPTCDESARSPVHSPTDKHAVMNRMAARRFVASTPRRLTEVEYGPVYAKQVRSHKKPTVITATRKLHNVATGSPAGDAAARQTATSAATITDPPEDKTETTLNQIKNMLQSVLTEVKTNSNVGNPPAQPKKDAVVQNGPARGYEYGASQLLQSYTYSPYNMNPYVPSCSHPMSCSNYIYPEYSGAKCMPFQQYPLLIQPQKHLCNNYYRDSNFTKPVTKHAASAATNTEQSQERSKETEQLIKEIYKSMALNMEESSKDNSIREYTKPKKTEKKYNDVAKLDSERESKNIAQAISEIFRNTHPRDSTVTGTTDTTLNSYLNPNKAKVISEDAVKKNRKTERNSPQNEHSTKHRRDDRQERMSTHHETEEQSDESDDTAVDDTEESSSATDTVEEVQVKKERVKPTEPKEEKSGIFKKMFKIFLQRRRKRRMDDATNDSEKDLESDSDDYQTVYSHKVADATPKPKKIQTVRSRPHSKVFHSKQPQKRRSRTKSPEKHSRTSPYMEQEYRRYWDEKLMFQENQRQRYYNAAARQPADRDQRNRYPYYQIYDARPVLVDPIRQMPPKMPSNVLKPSISASKNQRPIENYNESRPNNQGFSNYQNNPKTGRNTTNTGPTGPHFVTAKSNGNRKSMFAKGLLKKCKPCAQKWKELIING